MTKALAGVGAKALSDVDYLREVGILYVVPFEEPSYSPRFRHVLSESLTNFVSSGQVKAGFEAAKRAAAGEL